MWGLAEDLVEKGHVRTLGVGNVGAAHLHGAMLAASQSPPLVLQNKLSVYFPGHYEDGAPGSRNCSLDGAVAKGLIFQGYGVSDSSPGLLRPGDDPHVRQVAKRHGLSPEQALYAWALQLGAAVLVDADDAAGQEPVPRRAADRLHCSMLCAA